ncbi:hypothetical protein FOA52_002616 [Chlamydomonas sp. UWO 241]|nr:hypothetical protein FOA52_002616 [Chlamydomonas sp. UWO 241]
MIAGACSPCLGDQLHAGHCRESGHAMLLDCVGGSWSQAGDVSLRWPLPAGATHVGGDVGGTGQLRVLHACSPATDGGISSPLSSVGVAVGRMRRLAGDQLHPYQQKHTNSTQGTPTTVENATRTSLLTFELVMLLVLGVALPVVYWRKTRVAGHL